ncbi:MAG: tetratricopeptide repeat protein, partial [Planctomycetes bacterium]|nr:tetratricopeptide repeat protein [Planctomycetota bacterium]
MRPSLVCLIVLIAMNAGSIAHAADPDLRRGAKLLSRKNYKDAEAALVHGLSREPRNADGHLLLGIARYHLGHPSSAEREFRSAINLHTSHPARALYYLGLCQSALGDHRSARATFARLRTDYSGSEEAAMLEHRSTHAHAPSVESPNRWSLVLEASGGYDDNPTRSTDLSNSGGSAPSGDNFASEEVGVTVPIGTTPFRLHGFGYGKEYATFPAYNVFELRGDLEAVLHPRLDATVIPSYTVLHIWLDTTSYETQHRAAVRWHERWNDVLATDLKPYAVLKLHPQPFTGSDGSAVGVNARLRWDGGSGPVARVEPFANGEAFQASTAYLGWTQALVGLRARTQRYHGWGLEAFGLYRYRAYAAFDANLGVNRRDHRTEEGLDLSDRPVPWLTLHGDVTFEQNRSNAARYRYSENIYA